MYLSPKSIINHSVAAASQLMDIPALQPLPAQTGRGFFPLYHLDIENRCPGCGRSHWHVGRTMAECAHCETALPLALAAVQPNAPRITGRYSKTAGRVN